MCVHVGDSRTYLFHESEHASADRRPLHGAGDGGQGDLTQDEPSTIPARTSSPGRWASDPDVAADLPREIEVRRDILLLCSDGLSNTCLDAEIRR